MPDKTSKDVLDKIYSILSEAYKGKKIGNNSNNTSSVNENGDIKLGDNTNNLVSGIKEAFDDGLDSLFGSMLSDVGDLVSDAIETAIPGAGQIISLLTSVVKGISSIASATNTFITDKISSVEALTDATSKLETRLTSLDWDSVIDNAYQKVGALNGVYTQQEYLTNYQTLVEYGLQQDIDEKAAIMSMADKISSTYTVYSAQARELMRLQQEDSTELRLGLDVALNSYLTQLTESTEYLSEISTNVSNALLGAEAMIGSSDQSIEFEYAVQKWLGAMYNAGMSSSTVEAISKSLNSLGTGDVSNISGTGTLLALAAANSGLDYSALATGGLDATSVNTLLGSVFSLLVEAGSSNNNVLMNQLAKTYGVSVTDLVAAQNLNSLDISSLYDESSLMSSENLQNVYNDSADTAATRMGMSQLIKNMLENAAWTGASAVVTNSTSYMTYRLGKALESETLTNAALSTAKDVMYGELGDEKNWEDSALDELGSIGTGIKDIGESLTGVFSTVSDINGAVSKLVEGFATLLASI